MKKTTDQRITELQENINEIYKIFSEFSSNSTNNRLKSIEFNTKLQKRVQDLEEQIVKKEPKKTINSRFNNIEFILSFIAAFTAINTFLIITYINR